MIHALASDSYSTRIQARQALVQAGRAAIEPLEHAVQSEEPETRLRAAEILIALRGRGFMGMGLQESEPAEEGAAGGQGTERMVPRPVVVASQVVPVDQYRMYGVTKPFPAESAGIQPGDRILAVNDKPIQGVKDLMREVIIIGPARLAVLLIERGGKRIRVPLTLTRNPVLQKNNGLEYMIQRDPPPPVDLEREEELKALPQRTQSTRRNEKGHTCFVPWAREDAPATAYLPTL